MFIVLTTLDKKTPVLINVDQIVKVRPYLDWSAGKYTMGVFDDQSTGRCSIDTTDNKGVDVIESYDQVIKLLSKIPTNLWARGDVVA